MHFSHRIEVDKPVEDVWDFLWQAERVGACLPGCQEVRTLEPYRHYLATVEERVGPFRARFDWEITVESMVALQQVTIAARGKDSKLRATARAQLALQITRREAALTALDIETDLQVTGKIATLGQVVIKRKADQIVKDFAEALQRQLQGSGVGVDHA